MAAWCPPRRHVLVALAAWVLGSTALKHPNPHRRYKPPKHKNATKTGLAAVTMFVPWNRPGARTRRAGAMMKTLKALHSYPDVDMTIVMTTNMFLPEASGLVAKQVVVDEPVCDPDRVEKFCMAWETIRLLENETARARLRYDVYIYTESDIMIPNTTFAFWEAHAPALYARGKLLVPLREEENLIPGKIMASDCFKPECVEQTNVTRDTSTVSFYANRRDRLYLQPYNPYSGCWLMDRQMYIDFLMGPMRNFTTNRQYSPWGIRESAASGLLWDPRLNGSASAVTHLEMKVWHQIPMNGVGKGDVTKLMKPETFHEVKEYEAKIDACDSGTGPCHTLI